MSPDELSITGACMTDKTLPLTTGDSVIYPIKQARLKDELSRILWRCIDFVALDAYRRSIDQFRATFCLHTNDAAPGAASKR